MLLRDSSIETEVFQVNDITLSTSACMGQFHQHIHGEYDTATLKESADVLT